MNVHELALAGLNDHRLFTALDVRLLGLGLFAVTGAQKAMIFGHSAEVAVLTGVATVVGGGVMRDLLPNRVPVILRREIYASAALVAAVIEVAGERLGWVSNGRTWIALMACFALRYLSLRYKWNLPRASGRDRKGD